MSRPGASVSCRRAWPPGRTDQMSLWVRSAATKAPKAIRPTWPSYVAPAGGAVLRNSSAAPVRTIVDLMMGLLGVD